MRIMVQIKVNEATTEHNRRLRQETTENFTFRASLFSFFRKLYQIIIYVYVDSPQQPPSHCSLLCPTAPHVCTQPAIATHPGGQTCHSKKLTKKKKMEPLSPPLLPLSDHPLPPASDTHHPDPSAQPLSCHIPFRQPNASTPTTPTMTSSMKPNCKILSK
ncbi:hypothetical protein RND81_05G180700 [Saponaria officinalis]|uniref:Uncharacterized protein n=1 Tax=Saponaria officinalis TaxID=3572 RepID=A0AAW1L248_SAPOF